MPLLETKGAASAQGFGLTLQQAAANYIEDVFSTYLYTGNSSTQTITNGIDLSGKGGLVWTKCRVTDSTFNNHYLTDTARGRTSVLWANTTDMASTYPNAISAFNSNGFSLGDVTYNRSGQPYSSWTFRKQPKFFDVVTYTGTGVARTIAHNLGSIPGCIIVKRTDAIANWRVYHRGTTTPSAYFLTLNATSAQFNETTIWNNTAPTSTVFSVGNINDVNASGGTYVAYLFAHNAGGFGLSGTDNVISCGKYTGNGSATGPTITLDWEPQWLMIKNASGTGNWNIFDNMRGLTVSAQNDAYLEANTTDAEASADWVAPNATGFQITTTSSELNTNTSTYIYIAIRRGPMKTPTSGTSVFNTAFSPSSTPPGFVAGFPVDFATLANRTGTDKWYLTSRLTGLGYMNSANTAAETTMSTVKFDYQNGWFSSWFGGTNYFSYMLRRAPGFFDEVCYTGNGTTLTINHNLGVKPELVICKSRSSGTQDGAAVCAYGLATFENLRLFSSTGNLGAQNRNDGTGNNYGFQLNNSTATTCKIGGGYEANQSGNTYVAYLFASCPGVSKVGSYTGNGSSQTINCGFTAGARFVLIKRTDSTGDWYVWDTARGIVAGNDPRLSLNSTAAEVTTDDSVDTDSTGFIVNQLAATNINVNAATYIFLAIA